MEDKTKKEKSIYNLELHETTEIQGTLGGKYEVTRVPGGWVYCFEYLGFHQSPIVFVPFNGEYHPNTLALTKK